MSDGWIKEERDHEYRMEQQRTKTAIFRSEHRKEAVEVIAAVIGIVIVVAIIAAALWTTAHNNSARIERESVRCAESGGTMLDIANSGRTCFHILDGSDG